MNYVESGINYSKPEPKQDLEIYSFWSISYYFINIVITLPPLSSVVVVHQMFFTYHLLLSSPVVSEKKIFEISANQNNLLALAAMLNF
jgi:hypothetical protein